MWIKMVTIDDEPTPLASQTRGSDGRNSRRMPQEPAWQSAIEYYPFVVTYDWICVGRQNVLGHGSVDFERLDLCDSFLSYGSLWWRYDRAKWHPIQSSPRSINLHWQFHFLARWKQQQREKKKCFWNITRRLVLCLFFSSNDYLWQKKERLCQQRRVFGIWFSKLNGTLSAFVPSHLFYLHCKIFFF